MADLKISQLPPLTGAALEAADVLAVVDGSASETKKINTKDLVQAGVQFLDALSIPGDKVDVVLQDGSVDTAALKDGSVTAKKLADQSTVVVGSPLPVSGEYIGQVAVDTATNTASVWNGSTWLAFRTGILDIQGGTVGAVTTGVTIVGDSASVLAQVDDSTVPAQFLAGPTASAGPVELRRIVSDDLPAADIDVAGVVSVPLSGGLTIDGGASGFGTDLIINNDIAPSDAFHVVSYTEHGLIKGGRPIESSDLPLASNTTPGALYPGPEFNITAGGQFTIANSVAPGEHPVVTYDGHGLITSGRNLNADDIPDLDASKINSGTLDGNIYLADNSVGAAKLDDYSTCYIQPNQPPTAEYLGQMWLNPDTSQLYAYARGSANDYWVPVGFGRLQQENLRFCGTYDAANSTILTLTDYGVSAGLALGPLLEPLAEQTGVYLLCQTPGNAISLDNLNGKNHTEGDWIVAVNEKWEFIDVGQGGGGGGGGGATVLNDLLDVDIDITRMADVDLRATYALADGDLLVYNSGTGTWKNQPQAVLDIPDKTSDLTNDGEDGSNPFVSEAEVVNILDGKNPDGTPNPGAPVYLKPGDDVSELSNDAGYITSADVGDGTITITKADGTEVGSFTVNQSGDTDIALPADVVPAPPGDGKLSIVNQNNTELFAFTANQATGTDTVVKLTAEDVGALPDDTELDFVPLGSWAAIPTL